MIKDIAECTIYIKLPLHVNIHLLHFILENWKFSNAEIRGNLRLLMGFFLVAINLNNHVDKLKPNIRTMNFDLLQANALSLTKSKPYFSFVPLIC